ncbi:MAG: hypothetical protein LBC61_03950 [Candidatus Peribacteria bacterium]|nr:hypothetical protein [Candidatus Peribacteria bacterium]
MSQTYGVTKVKLLTLYGGKFLLNIVNFSIAFSSSIFVGTKYSQLSLP